MMTIITLSTKGDYGPTKTLTEEEGLAMALKASVATPLEEQSAQEVHNYFKDLPSNFTSSCTFYAMHCRDALGHCCVFLNFFILLQEARVIAFTPYPSFPSSRAPDLAGPSESMHGFLALSICPPYFRWLFIISDASLLYLRRFYSSRSFNLFHLYCRLIVIHLRDRMPWF